MNVMELGVLFLLFVMPQTEPPSKEEMSESVEADSVSAAVIDETSAPVAATLATDVARPVATAPNAPEIQGYSDLVFVPSPGQSLNTEGQWLVDWGEVNAGETVDLTVEFSNPGTETLQIVEVNPSCGCTWSDYSSSVEPGGTGTVTLHVSTANMSGAVQRSARIRTDSTLTPEIQVILRGQVIPFLTVSPESLRFDTIDASQGVPSGTSTSTLEVRPGPALTEGLSSLRVEIPLNAQAALSANVSQDGDHWDVVFTLDHAAAYNSVERLEGQFAYPFNHSLMLYWNDGEQNQRLRVSAPISM